MHETELSADHRAYVAPLVFTPGLYAVVLITSKGGTRSLCETDLEDALILVDALNASDTRTEERNAGDYYANKARKARFLHAVLAHDRQQLQPDVVARIERDLEAARYVGD